MPKTPLASQNLLLFLDRPENNQSENAAAGTKPALNAPRFPKSIERRHGPANTIKPPMTKVSPLKVRVFDTCRLRYRYQYVDKSEGRVKPRLRPADTAGSLVHRVLFDFYAKVPVNERSRERLLDMFNDGWRALTPNYHRIAGVEKHYDDSVHQLENFADKFSIDQQPYLVEPYFQEEIAPGVTLFGRLDRLDENPDGTLHIIDYKTGTQPEEIDPKQLIFYALLVEAKLERPVTKASFWYLDDASTWTTDFSPEDKQTAREELIATVRAMDEVSDFPPTIAPHCAFCPYLKACEVRPEIEQARDREGW
jgi:putative RecB family exonuclease